MYDVKAKHQSFYKLCFQICSEKSLSSKLIYPFLYLPFYLCVYLKEGTAFPIGNNILFSVQVAQLLASMVTCETKINSNPFRMKLKTANNPDACLLTTTALIPGLGDKRSRQLLEHFGSLQELANATKESLEKVVGPATASSVYKFFHHPIP